MASYNDIVFLDGRMVHKVTELCHSLQPIGIDGFIATMKTHVHLIVENFLKVATLGRLFNPWRIDLSVSWSDGKRIWIPTEDR